MTIKLALSAAVLGGAWSSAALGQVIWCDNYDGYSADQPVIGQDCAIAGCPEDDPGCPTGLSWQAWNNDGNAGLSRVSAAESRSGPNSIGIIGGSGGSGGAGTDDLVHTVGNLGIVDVPEQDDVYAVSLWQFVPADAASGAASLNLLNTYPATANPNWSVAMTFDSASDLVTSWDGEELPLIKGEWVEIRVVINLDVDQQEIFYGGDLLTRKTWTGGVQEGGASAFAAFNLFGSSATWTAYYDDLSVTRLEPFGACCLEDGSCVPDVIQQDCDAIAYSAYQGIGSSCTAADCLTRVPGEGWRVDPTTQPGGPGVNYTFSGDTTQGDDPAREDCDETGTGSPDEQFAVEIAWAQEWTFESCGADFNSLLTIGTAPCLADIAFGDDDCGDDASVPVELDPGANPGEAVVYVTLEGLGSGEAGAYDFVVRARCPDIDRDPEAIDNDGAACFDNDTDPVNVGCNGGFGGEAFSTMDADGTYAGTLGNFMFDGGGRRDLDWYRINPTLPGTLNFSAIGQGPGLLIQWGELDDQTKIGGSACFEPDGTTRTDTALGNAGAECNNSADGSLDVVAGGDYFILITFAFNDPENVPCGDDSYYELTVSGLSAECTPGGDANGDGCVDFADILVVLGAWGTGGPDGDTDCSGTVDFADILVILSDWGNGCE